MLRYLAFTAMALAADAAGANDLRQLYALALLRDASLQAAVFQRDAAIESRPQALAQWLPQISASTSAARERFSFDVSQQLPGNPLSIVGCALSSTGTTQQCSGTQRAFGLNLAQTLWSYQAFSQLKEASFQSAAAEAALQGARQSLVLRLARVYFRILSAADQLATDRSEREAFGNLLSQALGRERTGVGPRSDVDQAQAFYDATEQGVIDAQNALDDADLALTEIVGPHGASLAPLREEIPLEAPDPPSAEDWVASARADNPDVRSAQLTMEAASREIGAQRGRALPTLSLSGSGSKITQDAVLGGDQRLDTVAISFNWPLLQGGAIASAVRQARALHQRAQALYDSTQRDAERQTRAAYRGIVSGIQRIGAARRAVESGKHAVEASRRNVEFGTGTEFELLNAQNNYYAALRAYSQSRYDYLTSVLTLKQQAGRLSEHDLAAIDDLLVERAP
jgi:outer membrane protein